MKLLSIPRLIPRPGPIRRARRQAGVEQAPKREREQQGQGRQRQGLYYSVELGLDVMAYVYSVWPQMAGESASLLMDTPS